MKETKTRKKFIQCSLKVSFQVQRNPQKYKNPNKIMRFAIYTFSYSYIYFYF